jgi:hypothetical protein
MQNELHRRISRSQKQEHEAAIAHAAASVIEASAETRRKTVEAKAASMFANDKLELGSAQTAAMDEQVNIYVAAIAEQKLRAQTQRKLDEVKKQYVQSPCMVQLILSLLAVSCLLAPSCSCESLCN